MATIEREVKLEAPDDFSLSRLPADIDGYVSSPVRLHRLHTVYYDTDDLRLTRWGVSLRHRAGEGWTLKLPVEHALEGLSRAEHVFEGERDRIPPRALELATAFLRGAPVHPVAELRTIRAARELESQEGKRLAEMVEDDVRVVDGARIVRHFRQIEIELKDDAPPETLHALTRWVRHHGAGDEVPIPKNVRALGKAAEAPELPAPRLKRRSRLHDLVRAAFARSVHAIVRYDAPLRLDTQPEAVHHARTSVRRLRSDLRTFMLVLDRQWASRLREDLRWLADGLGDARDADVILERLEVNARCLPSNERSAAETVLEPLREKRKQAYDQLAGMLHEQRYTDLLSRAVEAAKDPVFERTARRRARACVPTILKDAWRPLCKRVRSRKIAASDRDLHRIRIKAKRLRYAAEAIAPVAGNKMRSFAERVEALQTLLGDQHDAVVAQQRLKAEHLDPEAAFAAGRLAGAQADAAQEARQRWWGCWKRVERGAHKLAAIG